jgi:hypothetical protein
MTGKKEKICAADRNQDASAQVYPASSVFKKQF